MAQRFSIRWNLHYAKQKTKDLNIQVIVTMFTKRFTLYSPFKSTPENWSLKKMAPKPNHPNFQEIIDYQFRTEKEIRAAYETALRISGASFEFVKNYILDTLNGKNKNIEFIRFTGLIDYFIQLKSNSLKPNTLLNYNSLKQSIQAFEIKSGKSILTDNFNMMIYNEYKAYLQSLDKLDGTIKKMTVLIKSLHNFAVENGIIVNLDYKKFKVKYVQQPPILLVTPDDLDKLINYDFSTNQRYEYVRDVFVFLCLTGQRWSDVSNMQWNDIQGRFWILRQQKTNHSVRVPLRQGALEILNKYRHLTQFVDENNFSFNHSLKKVAKIAGLDDDVVIYKSRGESSRQERIVKKKWELMSVHKARVNLITTLLQKGIPENTVKSISGHSSHSAFQRYVALSDELILKELDELDNR